MTEQKKATDTAKENNNAQEKPTKPIKENKKPETTNPAPQQTKNAPQNKQKTSPVAKIALIAALLALALSIPPYLNNKNQAPETSATLEQLQTQIKEQNALIHTQQAQQQTLEQRLDALQTHIARQSEGLDRAEVSALIAETLKDYSRQIPNNNNLQSALQDLEEKQNKLQEQLQNLPTENTIAPQINNASLQNIENNLQTLKQNIAELQQKQNELQKTLQESENASRANDTKAQPLAQPQTLKALEHIAQTLDTWPLRTPKTTIIAETPIKGENLLQTADNLGRKIIDRTFKTVHYDDAGIAWIDSHPELQTLIRENLRLELNFLRNNLILQQEESAKENAQQLITRIQHYFDTNNQDVQHALTTLEQLQNHTN